MKYKKIMLVSIFLLAILAIGAVSASEDIASEDIASDDNLTAGDGISLIADDDPDDSGDDDWGYEIENVEFCSANAIENDVIVKIPKAGIDGVDDNFYAILDLEDEPFEKELNITQIDNDDEFYLIRTGDLIDDAPDVDDTGGTFTAQFFKDGENYCFAEGDVNLYVSPYFSQYSTILYNNPVVILRGLPEGADELAVTVLRNNSQISKKTFNVSDLDDVSKDWEDYEGEPVYEFTDSQIGITEAGEYNITLDFIKDSTLLKTYSGIVNVALVNVIVAEPEEEEDEEGKWIPGAFHYVTEDIFVIEVPENLSGYYVNIFKDGNQLKDNISITDLIYNDGWGWQAQARSVKLNDLDITESGNYSIRLELYADNGELVDNVTNDIPVKLVDDGVNFRDIGYTEDIRDVIELSISHQISSDDYYRIYLNGEFAGNITPFSFFMFSMEDKFYDYYDDLSENARFLKVGHYDANITFVHNGTENDFATGEFNVFGLNLTSDKDTYLAGEDILISFGADEPKYGKLRPYHILGWGLMGPEDNQIFNTLSNEELMDVWKDGVFTINVGEYSDYKMGSNYVLIQYEIMQSEDDGDGFSVFGLINFNIVNETSVTVEAPDVIKYYKGPEKFVVTVKDYVGNPIDNATVKININGVNYTRTTGTDGQASLALGIPAGNYTATVFYDDIKKESNVVIKSTVSGNNITKIFKNETQYYATFVDTNGNLLTNATVEFNINGVFYKRTTNASGVAKMNINLNPGEYIITAINPNSTEMYSNVVTVLPNIVDNENLTKYYKNDSQYVIKLLDDKGNPVGANETVEFNINGVLYKRTSNATGHVKLNINLDPGEYIITADYKGYKTANTITVKPILETEDLTMKYRDGSKFEARLLDAQGNPFADQNITFNINGVFYNKITNASGIASLNINLMAGEYIITSMYSNGAAVSNKITISS
ncbi:hypothetical protein [Methanobrevibacter sp.]|uniref:hypothetical protein n=1 Tax=Methanobrevibacter sp. TaxID=66852 RepID=UPI00388F14CF